ncbi:hypothetical protein DFQ30_011004 [Apophysomyces sp. BC1015]|nr:hypothetical protein DFQ30_011004 [Apophysomyces sp. BC1015]KAG0181174.1 hypothetical protein DFQ29_009134 [Apophysomyces sp. BC1021]
MTTTETVTQHRLRTVGLGGKIDEAVFPYLSQRCPRLSSVEVCVANNCRLYIVYLPNPNINNLSITTHGPENIYQLTRTSNTEKIQKLTYQRQFEGATRWFYEDDPKLHELNYDEVETIFVELCNSCDICSPEEEREMEFAWREQEESQGRIPYPICMNTTDKKHTVWIQYHNID